MGKSLKAYCAKCENKTNQNILFKDSEVEPIEIIGRNNEGDDAKSLWYLGVHVWELTKCLGCDSINLKHLTRTSPDGSNDIITKFPKKLIRKPPSWIAKLPIKYVELLREIYIAINNDILITALIGIRTLLDIFIVGKVGDEGSFKSKILKMVQKGFITKSKADVLDVAIDAGSASAHRGYKPDIETVNKIMDIVENLLQSEIVDRETESIKDKTPKRA